MILVADSGSTKTNWCLSESNDKQYFVTSGINPFFLEKEEIMDIFREEFPVFTSSVSEIYFYGAGCTPEKQPILQSVLNQYFQAKKTEVFSDLLGAARSLCGNESGIACILGTGSNSCYYDGKQVRKNIPPLGFILGDEGSGAVLGKKLIVGILKDNITTEIKTDFFNTYKTTPAEIIDSVYRQTFPNRYLAQFTIFIAEHIEFPEIRQLVENSFSEFVTKNILQYKSADRFPVHFTGSVAYYFQEILGSVIRKFGLTLGKIVKDPLPGLVAYHAK
jgi:N-acetylglucosamine kinase-like BadF-type ATPase